jgi:uncharacterized protein YdeI (YjbR/CyaY-like superfamily)
MDTLTINNRKEWRAWLEANHATETEIWLVFHKKNTRIKSIAYNASVEEALCFGWIDSLIKKLDEERYARKFTPRKENSQWSATNIKRVEKIIEAGLMTEPGLRLVKAAKQSGRWDQPVRKTKMQFEMHPEFKAALAENPTAQQFFEKLAPTYQKQYLTWIAIAKRADTRKKRIAEATSLLERGEKLGLK